MARPHSSSNRAIHKTKKVAHSELVAERVTEVSVRLVPQLVAAVGAAVCVPIGTVVGAAVGADEPKATLLPK